MKFVPHRLVLAAAVASAFAWAPATQARVTRIIIDETTPITGRPYVELTGRAFGELDPHSSHNELLTDIRLAPRNKNGKVEYIASFVLRKPTDDNAISGVMWHDVPNRGGDVNFPADSFAGNDVQLVSGWQGDNADATAVPANVDCVPPGPCAPVEFNNHYVKTPVLTGVTGRVFARIVNRTGTAAPLMVQNNPL